MTSKELVTLAHQAQLAGDGAIEAQISKRATYAISCDLEGGVVTCSVNDLFLTEGGWKYDHELGFYDEGDDENIREDAECPEVPISVFLAEFPNTDWHIEQRADYFDEARVNNR